MATISVIQWSSNSIINREVYSLVEKPMVKEIIINRDVQSQVLKVHSLVRTTMVEICPT